MSTTYQQRCDQGVACVEVAARYLAASEAHQAGLHLIADELAAKGDQFAQVHQLWQQLESEVTS